MQIAIVAKERLVRQVESLQRALEERGFLVDVLIIQPANLMTPGEMRFALERFVGRAVERSARLLVLSPELFTLADLHRLRETATAPVVWVEEPRRDLQTYASDYANVETILVNSVGTEQEWDTLGQCHSFLWWEPDEDLARLSRARGKHGEGIAYIGNLDNAGKRSRYFELASFGKNVGVYGRTAPDYLRMGKGVLDRAEDWMRLYSTSSTILLDIDELDGDPPLSSKFVYASELGLPLFVVGGTGREELPPGVISVPNLKAFERALAEFGETTHQEIGDSVLTEFTASARAAQLVDLLSSNDRAGAFPVTEQIVEQAPVIDLRDVDYSERNWGEGEKLAIAVVGVGLDRETSRSTAVKRSLEKIGHDVFTFDVSDYEALLQRDSRKICQHQIDISPVFDQLQSNNVSLAIFSGINARMTDASRQLMENAGIDTVAIDDSFSRWSEHLAQLCLSFDAVFTSSTNRVKFAQAMGLDNIHYLPHFINPDYLVVLGKQRHKPEFVPGFVKVRRSIEREYELSPSLSVDGANVPDSNIHHFQHLMDKSLAELADCLVCDYLLMSHEGHSDTPTIHEIMPYAWVSANNVFFPRNSDTDQLVPYSMGSTWVGEIGELSKRAQDYEPVDKETVPWSKELANGTLLMKRLIEADKSRRPRALYRRGSTFRLEVQPGFDYRGPVKIEIRAPIFGNSTFKWQIGIAYGDETVDGIDLTSSVQFVITEYEPANPISLTVSYLGPNLTTPWLTSSPIDVEVFPIAAYFGVRSSGKILVRNRRWQN